VNSEAIRRLSEFENEGLTQIGVEFLKQISAGQMKINIKSSMSKIALGGYLKIIKVAGPDFINTLSSYGFSQMGQIMSLIKSLKEKS